MSNGNGTVAVALGAGGGLLLWYLLRDGERARATTPPREAPAQTASTSSAPSACVLRLDAQGLTADGQRVAIADAIHRCKTAGRVAVAVSTDASATVYAQLMTALGQTSLPVSMHRNARRSRSASPRARSASPRALSANDVDLHAFASRVRSLAAHVEANPTPDGRARGRFGERKVFIAAIWRALRRTEYAHLSRAAFDELLVRALRLGLLRLARADYVVAMDPDEVRDSEIINPVAGSHHFVVLEHDELATERNTATFRHFTLRSYPRGHRGGSTLRWFRADEPTTWADARDRIIAAGIADAGTLGRPNTPGGWMLSIDPTAYRDDAAEPLPIGGSRGD